MPLSRYLWLLLCYAQFSRSSLMQEYQEITNDYLYPSEQPERLPIELGKDRNSGCICRASTSGFERIVVCFGNYGCRKFPKVKFRSERLKVRTSVIVEIRKGDLDAYYYLKALGIEANHKLIYVEPGAFQNLTNLEELSISYNTLLNAIHEDTFQGLINLHNLTLVNNGFENILLLTPAFKPSILPSLRGLDLSENVFGNIPEETFLPMKGTHLKRLDVNLCRLDSIHPKSLLVFKYLEELNISDNDLDSSMIKDFLVKMVEAKINLLGLDLSGMGFRKQPPRELMNVIAQSTIRKLFLARNQFEIIDDNTFPVMVNIELIDLRKVLAIVVESKVFDPEKFPNLKVLLLSGNNLPGMHRTPIASQLMFLDLSDNKGSVANPMYYEIDRDTFIKSKELRILNIGFNRIRSIFDYTFRGLENLKILNMENGTVYFIGKGSFKPLKRLELLNLANNPLEANQNLTSQQFEGLNELKVLILENCGIQRFYDEENMFESMPNLTHLNLKNNQLTSITVETLKPLKFLQVLDLSQNLMVSWWLPLFLAAGVRPLKIYLTHNKISHFSMGMIQDLNYLLENRSAVELDVMDNIFICDCNSMFKTYRWLQVNGTEAIKVYFYSSKFQCSSPDIWENRKVAEYLSSIKTLKNCLMYEKISNIMVLVWTAPSLVTIALIIIVAFIIYRYRTYIRYWVFLAKVALGNNVKRSNNLKKGYKYDAFVSYCNEDKEFVHNMLTQLESNPPYLKLCVYERDFEIGAFISEAVHTSINESKYIILIISNSFVKSHWCRWETQLAEYRRIFLEDGTSYDPLVLIRVGEVQNKYLTTTLKYLLKTKIYHTWDEKNQEEFWRKLRNVLTKSK